MAEFNLKIYATDKVIYDGKCTSLVLPSTDGEYAILHNREIRFIENDEKKTFFTGAGFCYFNNNDAVVFVDTAELPEEIDERRAREAKERAEERLRQKQSKHDFYTSQAALSRAMSRMQEAARHKRGI